MVTDAELTFRPHTGEDLPFLLNSWGSSYYQGSSALRVMPPEEFHAYHKPIRERFFSKPNTTVIVCCPTSDPWHIIGWIAVELTPSALILQYLYVKAAFRSQGIAKELARRALPRSPVVYTHLTERASRIIARKYDLFKEMRHLPHLV